MFDFLIINEIRSFVPSIIHIRSKENKIPTAHNTSPAPISIVPVGTCVKSVGKPAAKTSRPANIRHIPTTPAANIRLKITMKSEKISDNITIPAVNHIGHVSTAIIAIMTAFDVLFSLTGC